MIDGIWQTRWDGLDKQLRELVDRYDKAKQPKNAHFDRMDTFFTLVRSLHAFGKSQFNFFRDGFSSNLLEPDDQFRAETSLAATLDQISFDIAAIEKAANQRILGDEQDLKTLNVADYLTGEALKIPTALNVEEAGTEDINTFVLREPATILTYFQKSYSIRLIPYAPIVFIGIPITCKYTYRDFLAIPHEVGHFVYRHGLITQGLYDQIVSRDPGIVEWTKKWMEEIFADIYGATIAGPLITVSFQDLQMNYSIDDFFTGDGSHPVPVLRPYIYLNTLAKLEEKNGGDKWSLKLRENWNNYLKKRIPSAKSFKFDLIGPDYFDESELKLKFKLKDNASYFDVGGVISMEGTNEGFEKALDIAVAIIQGVILESISPNNWLEEIDLPSLNDENAIALLYARFENHIETLLKRETSLIDDLLVVENNEKEIIWVASRASNRELGTTSSADVETTKSKLLERRPIPRGEWLKVLDAGGWTVKGPDCDGSGGVNC